MPSSSKSKSVKSRGLNRGTKDGFATAQEKFSSDLAKESWIRNILLHINMLVLFPPLEMLYFYIFFIYLFCVSGTILRTLLGIYWINMFFELDGAPSGGGWDLPNYRYREFCRKLRCWDWVRQYFDGEVVKTAELPPSHNYLMCYHPHGIISMGLQGALALNACDFTSKFPGIDRSVATLVASFKIPFFREWILMNGFISCGKKTLLKLLTHREPNPKSVVLVPGGVSEPLRKHFA